MHVVLPPRRVPILSAVLTPFSARPFRLALFGSPFSARPFRLAPLGSPFSVRPFLGSPFCHQRRKLHAHPKPRVLHCLSTAAISSAGLLPVRCSPACHCQSMLRSGLSTTRTRRAPRNGT